MWHIIHPLIEIKDIMSKEQDSDNKKATLTDAELQQATGGATTMDKYGQECQAQSDRENCVKRAYCEWKVDKDGHSHCTFSL